MNNFPLDDLLHETTSRWQSRYLGNPNYLREPVQLNIFWRTLRNVLVYSRLSRGLALLT